ncbi:pyruvate dehydrogenase (acetyl-transferring) E1 component subunit alpha [Altererythrobacter sp. CC-YST694]|uniref:pyruvate dehydrogenase (acetyl-transferring) E1 component subunit alpha n=1 Tax=Altererythrobacter sp. CC-YST694 TaxID=2755038 RepID=UPI001D01005B|nr:pyruvate dehydrogenase (acetyl-transferring) E1 component subunit alpha [Altererythrobacter sp. CC-YST694]
MAKPASKSGTSSSKTNENSAGESSAATAGDNFALHSLQEAHAQQKRYQASDEELLDLYEKMLLIRRFEERAGQLYGLGLIGGFCHLYIGQEAVAVGIQSALESGKDSVITGYRDHGHMLAYGIDPKIIMAELTGRAAGISRGKGGSMHMFSTEHAFYGGHGIVGAQVPLGAGLAFGHKYREDGGICVAYFGDGAANQGQVYETFNMASLWKLPILFVIENNQYAMGTSVKRSSAETHFYRRGTAFRIPGMDVNGMDVLEVRQATEIAAKHVREGHGPVLMELNTYRYRGHSMSDPAKYRTREEVQGVREKKDPIDHAKAELLERGISEDRLKEIEKVIRAQVAEAADFAENSPEPEANELYTDVLVGSY